MAIKLPLILLAASTATAQLTTSFWMPSGKQAFGTDRLRWRASVVGAEGDRVTLAYRLDDDPDYSALGFTPNDDTHITMTFASTLWEVSSSDMGVSTITGDKGLWLRCEKQSAGPATCTQSLNAWLLDLDCRPNTRSAEVWSDLWTFSDKGTVGVETIVRSFGGQSRAVSEWCTNTAVEPPSVGSFDTFTRDADIFATYEFIITAGEEKLSATAGSGPTALDAKPTGTESGTGSASGTGPAEATGTGAAAPMKTMAPLVAGLGAAVAVFL